MVDLTGNFKGMGEAVTELLNENSDSIHKEISQAVLDCAEIDRLNGDDDKCTTPVIKITFVYTISAEGDTAVVQPEMKWGHNNQKKVKADKMVIDQTPSLLK